jgi:hypothetical protein
MQNGGHSAIETRQSQMLLGRAEIGLPGKLGADSGMRILCGLNVAEAGSDKSYHFVVVPNPNGKQGKVSDFVLLALHYESQILARYPRSDSKLDPWGMELRRLVGRVIEEGIWSDSNLLEYTALADRVKFSPELADLKNATRLFALALIRPVEHDELDLAAELPPDPSPDELICSVIAVMQGVLRTLDDDGVLLMDRAFRYLKSYHDEGAEYGDLAAARSMANRAFRDAGGEAG